MLNDDGKNLEKMMIKTVVVGCGKIAGISEDSNSDYIYSHSKAILRNESFELTACCDININNAKELANKYGFINFGVDYIDYIKKTKADLVVVSTLDSSHYQVVRDVLEADYVPKLIFLEKPACESDDEFKTLLELSKDRNVKIIVNHTRRFEDKHIQLKESIENDFFGKLFRADVYYYSGWSHNGIHVIDTLNFLFNDNIEIKNLSNTIVSPYKGDFTADFELYFKNIGASIYLHGVDEDNYQLFEFDFKFNNSRLRIEDFGNRIVYEKKEVNEMKENVLVKANLKLKQSNNSPMQNAYKVISNYFNNNSSLQGYLIEDIDNTMTIIWEGKTWIQKFI